MGESKRRRESPAAPAFRFPRSAADASIASGMPTLLVDVEVRRHPGSDFDPLRHPEPPRLHDYLAQRYPSAPPGARWRLCGGFIVRFHDAGDGVSGAVVAFRLPDAPYYALVNLVSRQGVAALERLRSSTTTDGLTLSGGFLADEGGVPAFVGTAEPFAEEHGVPRPGTLTLALPDWDANSFERILRPFGLVVRTG